MEESILTSTKKILGLDEGYDVFDLDIITFINSALSTLDQLGVGPVGGYTITGPEEVWDDLTLPANQLQLVKTYLFLKVRMLFDPPTTSYLISALNEQLKEYEWRLNSFVETEAS
jgi:hypothetical protein